MVSDKGGLRCAVTGSRASPPVGANCSPSERRRIRPNRSLCDAPCYSDRGLVLRRLRPVAGVQRCGPDRWTLVPVLILVKFGCASQQYSLTEPPHVRTATGSTYTTVILTDSSVLVDG